MPMMGGGATRQVDSLLSLVNLLADPETAAKTVKDHMRAIQEHQTAKAEAIAACSVLDAKKAEHDERETMVAAREKAVQLKSEDLAATASTQESQQVLINSVLASLEQQKRQASNDAAKAVKDAKDLAASMVKAAKDEELQIISSANGHKMAAERTLADAQKRDAETVKAAKAVEDRSTLLREKEIAHQKKVDSLGTFLKGAL